MDKTIYLSLSAVPYLLQQYICRLHWVIFRDAFLQSVHVIIILCVLQSPRSAIQSLLDQPERLSCTGWSDCRRSYRQTVITELQATECVALVSW